MSVFRVGLTRDFLRPDGELGFGDIGLEALNAPGVAWEFLPESAAVLEPARIAPYDGLLILGPRLTAASLEGNQRLVVAARFGVGYDNIDVDACTRAGVAVTITPDGVRRPVAVAALTLLLACSHKLLIKDRLTRAGRWAEKLDHMGQGLTGRTLGVLGLGNIGREIVRLAAPLELRCIGHDPLPGEPIAGLSRVSLDELLREADYVVVACALTESTHHLLNAARLALLKPTAYVINVARGPIIDQRALTEALAANRLAGAGLDVFDPEPIDPHDPLLKLDNVIVAPHALCWTDECFQGIGASACRGLLAAASGRPPDHIVNREVLSNPTFQGKLAAYIKSPSGPSTQNSGLPNV